MEGVIGTILMFAGNFAPKSWAFCNGAIINIASNTALFSILGTTYGGNGTSTFALPDLQGRVPLGAGQGPGLSNYSLGQSSGVETETLSLNTMASHNHPASVTIGTSSANATLAEAANNLLATPTGAGIYATPAQGNANYGGFSAQVLSAGGTPQPFSILQPYLSVYFVICQYGVFPARN